MRFCSFSASKFYCWSSVYQWYLIRMYICAIAIAENWLSAWKQTTKHIKHALLLLSFKDRTAFCDWFPLVCLLFCWHHLLMHSSRVWHILIFFAGSVVSEQMLLVSEKDFHCCQLEDSQRFQTPATKGWQEHDTSRWLCIPDCCLRQGQHSNLESLLSLSCLGPVQSSNINKWTLPFSF